LFFSSFSGFSASADRKTSNGAPFSICATNFPEEPNDSLALCPVAF
jgi:hypothetical protein